MSRIKLSAIKEHSSRDASRMLRYSLNRFGSVDLFTGNDVDPCRNK
jgi:hypothetical protein